MVTMAPEPPARIIKAIAEYYFHALILVTALLLVALPIHNVDTDLWYHLAGGRHLFDTGSLYNPFLHSYIEPAREMTNYFAAFQAMVFVAYEAGGGYALVALKALLVIATLAFAGATLQKDNESNLGVMLLMALIAVLMLYKGFTLRPYLVSYLMMALFIYILECRRNWLPALPVLTVILVNCHGVEWVVGGLILGAYFLRSLLTYQLVHKNLDELKPDLWLVACLPAMFLNPNGVLVLLTPFIQSTNLDMFILELKPVSLVPRFDFSHGFPFEAIAPITLVMWIAAMVSVLSSSHNRDDWLQHISALILAAGGVVLLAMAQRFTWEFVLLCVPLFGIWLNRYPARHGILSSSVLILSLVLVAYTFNGFIKGPPLGYPLDKETLPVGTTDFIEQMELEGRYLAPPGKAGYLEWRLPGQVKVFMDMQFPPFTHLDYFEYQAAVHSGAALTRHVNRYAPSMIGVSMKNKGFPRQAAEALGYAPVFFDEVQVLYIDAKRYPDVVKDYRISFIDPFDSERIAREQLVGGIAELERMQTISFSPDRALTLIGMLIAGGNTARAAVHIDDMIAAGFADDPALALFTARVHHMSNNCLLAIPFYEAALAPKSEPSMHRQVAECYFITGDTRRAYEHFSKGMNPYLDNSPTPIIYYQYALSAVAVGKNEEALGLLEMIEIMGVDASSPFMAEVQTLKDSLSADLAP